MSDMCLRFLHSGVGPLSEQTFAELFRLIWSGSISDTFFRFLHCRVGPLS